MALTSAQKTECFNAAVEITKAAAGTGNYTSGTLADALEKTYDKLVVLREKTLSDQLLTMGLYCIRGNTYLTSVGKYY